WNPGRSAREPRAGPAPVLAGLRARPAVSSAAPGAPRAVANELAVHAAKAFHVDGQLERPLEQARPGDRIGELDRGPRLLGRREQARLAPHRGHEVLDDGDARGPGRRKGQAVAVDRGASARLPTPVYARGLAVLVEDELRALQDDPAPIPRNFEARRARRLSGAEHHERAESRRELEVRG